MLYRFNNDFVLRDIGGIYFAVDITDKYIYKNKKMYSVNKTAFVLLQIAQNKSIFSVEDLFNDFLPLLNAQSINKDEILNDLYLFCEDSTKRGMLEYGK